MIVKICYELNKQTLCKNGIYPTNLRNKVESMGQYARFNVNNWYHTFFKIWFCSTWCNILKNSNCFAIFTTLSKIWIQISRNMVANWTISFHNYQQTLETQECKRGLLFDDSLMVDVETTLKALRFGSNFLKLIFKAVTPRFGFLGPRSCWTAKTVNFIKSFFSFRKQDAFFLFLPDTFMFANKHFWSLQ